MNSCTDYLQQSSWKFALCPDSSDPVLDWTRLGEFNWIRAMRGCRQDAEHHAEGDVFEHTRLVCESLLQLPAWQESTETERSILLAAALLHDVAKPLSTKIDAEGRISSLRHTKTGAAYARDILWDSNDFSKPDFWVREQIVKLVRFSGLPIWFMEKDDPRRAVLRASLSVRTDLLAILAEADIRGRRCRDQSELLNRLALFREFCLENNCFGRAAEFPTEHSRFAYFRLDSKDPLREVYDDRGPMVTIMSGLPASGKDTWIKKNNPELPVVSLDEIRAELKVDPDDNQGPVLNRARQLAAKYLKEDREFIWNATNVSGSLRSTLLSWLEAYKPRLKIVYVEAPPAVLKQRNRNRKEPVPEAVIAKLVRRLEVPDLSEAHRIEHSIN